MAAAIDFAPSSPIWLFHCTAHVSPHTPRSKEKRNFSRNKNPILHLTRPRYCKLLFPSMAAAIDFAPSSPIWLFHCTAHVSPHTPRSKKETQFQQEQKSQTASHKAQPLQAAVSFHGCCNRFCAVVTDWVAALHSTRQRWRREQHTTGGKHAAETEPEKILQGSESSLC